MIEPAAPATPLPTQAVISREITAAYQAYTRSVDDGAPVREHPDRDYPPYRSTLARHPSMPLVAVTDPEAARVLR